MADDAGPAYPQQNRQDQLVELFPEYDIDLILESLPNHFSAEAVADWILTNSDNAPRRRKTHKRKAECMPFSDEEELLSDEDEIIEGLVLNKLLKELYSKYVINNENRVFQQSIRTLLASTFPTIRVDFINKAFSHSKDICSTMIACWFVSNKCTQKLQEFMNNPENIMWVTTDPIQNKRKHVPLDRRDDESLLAADYTGGIIRFKEIMQTLSNKYPQILQGIKLLNEAFTLKIEIPEGIEMFECGVCFTEKTIDKRIMCGNTESELRHSFCRTCLRGHASAAAEDMPLAEGAVGLKCMEFKCMNAIYYSTIRSLIPKEIRQRIDSRILEENLGLSGLNLERCRDCNYAVEMEETKEQNKVLECQNCEKKWCRLCQREWNEDHFGISCEELDKKTSVDRKRRKLEEKLNEVVVRTCGKCGLQMIKQDGCNKMTCRCGATMCYVCRKPNINYEHFCRHVRIPGVNKCDICPADTCTLWEDAQKRDNEEIERIQKEEGVLIDLPKNSDGERMEARNRREEQLNQMFQNPWENNGERNGNNNNNAALIHALEELNRPMYPLYPMINVQIGQQPNFGFNQPINQNLRFPMPREPPRFMPPPLPPPPPLPMMNELLFQRQERNENFNMNGDGMNNNMLLNNEYGEHGNLNNRILNFERHRVQQELNRVNPGNNPRGNNTIPFRNLPLFGMDQNRINAAPGNERINPGGLLNNFVPFNLNGGMQNQVGNEIRDNQHMNNLNRVENQHINNVVEQRREEDYESDDSSDGEIQINDDDNEDDEVTILAGGNVPVRMQVEMQIPRLPKRTPIQLAVDRLSDGAPPYEFVPLGVENFENAFNGLVNDCNAIADFAANDCNQAAELFKRNFLMNHPEHEEIAEIFQQFANEQNEFAELAKRHKANNEALFARLQELTVNRNQRNNEEEIQLIPDEGNVPRPAPEPNADRNNQNDIPQTAPINGSTNINQTLPQNNANPDEIIDIEDNFERMNQINFLDYAFPA